MSLLIRPMLKCPHCGHEQAQMLEVSSTIMNKFFINCDTESGGCDADYAIEINLKTIVHTYQLEFSGRSEQGYGGITEEDVQGVKS